MTSDLSVEDKWISPAEDRWQFSKLKRCVYVLVDLISTRLFLRWSFLLLFFSFLLRLRTASWTLSGLASVSKCSILRWGAPPTHTHTRSRGSMVKSGISHSKSCSCGRRELLQKSLNNHVFPLIYSKYLSREQIKGGRRRLMQMKQLRDGRSSGNAFVLITRKQYCCNYQPKQVY